MTGAWRAVGRLPAPARHLFFAVLLAAAVWAGGTAPSWAALRAAVAAAVIAWATPLVQSYGLGVVPAAGAGEGEGNVRL